MAEAQKPPERARAIKTLALDAAAGEALRALAARGIRATVLKGPGIARRLYAEPAERPYRDIDLLIAPGQLADAEQALRELGYRCPSADARPSERAPHHSSWRRPWPAPALIELHWTLYWCAADPEDVWTELSRDTQTISFAGERAAVLGDGAQALVVAVHALQHGGEAQPLEDLRRALKAYDEREWSQAAGIARRLGLGAELAAGLCLLDEGARLAERLALHQAPSLEMRLRGSGVPPVAAGLMRLAAAGSPRARARLLADELIPSPAFMRATSALARRGRRGLLAAYLLRPAGLLVKAPAGLRAWRAASRPPGAERQTQDPRAQIEPLPPAS